MTCILVATDGSESADRAVERAAHLAKSTGSELWIVNVIDDHGLSAEQLDEFTHAEHASLAELLSSLSAQILAKAKERAEASGVEAVHLESRRGDIARAIIEIAQEKQAEAIVVGKRGRGRLAGMLLGSVSHKLVSLAPCAVIVVP